MVWEFRKALAPTGNTVWGIIWRYHIWPWTKESRSNRQKFNFLFTKTQIAYDLQQNITNKTGIIIKIVTITRMTTLDRAQTSACRAFSIQIASKQKWPKKWPSSNFVGGGNPNLMDCNTNLAHFWPILAIWSKYVYKFLS